MAMIIDCSPVPVPEDEKAAITEAAYKARSEDRLDTDFESVSISKCVTSWELDDPERIEGRTERLVFYGSFPHNVETDSYRERYSIQCHKSVEYRNDVVFDQRDSCNEELERYILYEGLENEVRLQGSVSVEDTTAFLDHLMQYDFGKDAQARVDELLNQIQWVDYRIVRGRLLFSASFDAGGCATITFESAAERKGSLTFGKVYDQTMIC